MEYIMIKKDYWLTRWLKKPSCEEVKCCNNFIIKKNVVPKIGIDDSIINKVCSMCTQENKYFLFGKNITDYDDICQKLQLAKPLVLLILAQKGLLRCKKTQ